MFDDECFEWLGDHCGNTIERIWISGLNNEEMFSDLVEWISNPADGLGFTDTSDMNKWERLEWLERWFE